MKIAFSTLGCPDFDWSDIYSMAKDFGFDGIEMRGLGDESVRCERQALPRGSDRPRPSRSWRGCVWTIPCLSSGCVLKDTEKLARHPGGNLATISAWLPGWAPPISACWPTATPPGRGRWTTRWCWPHLKELAAPMRRKRA